ncbi:MAG: nuclear transport factor 2 family protein [Sphingomonadales bacterium]
MKPSTILLAACAMLSATAANARDAAISAPIKAMMAAFNKGDMATAKAMHTATPTIVDNVAPFSWSGADAFDAFVSDLGKAEAAAGKSDGAVVFGDPVDEVVSGDRAYVVTPSSYTYKQNGKTMRETGMTAFVLVKVAGAWKVDRWSWASPTAVVVK